MTKFWKWLKILFGEADVRQGETWKNRKAGTIVFVHDVDVNIVSFSIEGSVSSRINKLSVSQFTGQFVFHRSAKK